MEDDTTARENDKHGFDWYRTLVEELNDLATVVDTDGTITYVSPAVTRILGCEPDELIGREGYEFVHPDDRERNAEAVETVLSNPSESETVEVRFQHADGSWHWIEATLRNRLDDDVIGGILLSSRDITERKEYEIEVRKLAEVLTKLYEIGSDADLTDEEKAERILTAGCEYLDLPYGFLTQIEEGVQRMVHTVGDHELLQPEESAPLEHSYCRKTIESNGLVGIKNAQKELGTDDPAYEIFELGCYIGTKIMVGENLYGTFCFAGPTGRDQQFTSDQREVVKLLGQWTGYDLERQRFEKRLRGLQRFSQQLLLAESTEEVAETTIEIAANLFGLPLTAWWEHYSDADVLRPLVEGDEVKEIVGETPAFERGEGLIWESFESGEIRSYEDVTDSAAAYNPQTDLRAEVHVPCGTHGIITSAATEPRAFDEVDIESLRLLGALVSEAMTAVKREEQLVERGKVLQQQNDRLEEFADVVAHDLRNPLAGAIGSLEVARETNDEEFFNRLEHPWTGWTISSASCWPSHAETVGRPRYGPSRCNRPSKRPGRTPTLQRRPSLWRASSARFRPTRHDSCNCLATSFAIASNTAATRLPWKSVVSPTRTDSTSPTMALECQKTALQPSKNSKRGIRQRRLESDS